MTCPHCNSSETTKRVGATSVGYVAELLQREQFVERWRARVAEMAAA